MLMTAVNYQTAKDHLVVHKNEFQKANKFILYLAYNKILTNVCYNLNFQTQEIRKFPKAYQTKNNHFCKLTGFSFFELEIWL